MLVMAASINMQYSIQSCFSFHCEILLKKKSYSSFSYYFWTWCLQYELTMCLVLNTLFFFGHEIKEVLILVYFWDAWSHILGRNINQLIVGPMYDVYPHLSHVRSYAWTERGNCSSAHDCELWVNGRGRGCGYCKSSDKKSSVGWWGDERKLRTVQKDEVGALKREDVWLNL